MVKLFKTQNETKFVISMDVSIEDLDLVGAYDPALLTLKDEETKETYFRIGTTAGKGTVSRYGVAFSVDFDTYFDKIKVSFDVGGDEVLITALGVSVKKNLEKVQEQIVKALEELKNMKLEEVK